jgi:hypothetical protein
LCCAWYFLTHTLSHDGNIWGAWYSYRIWWIIPIFLSIATHTRFQVD